MSIESSIRNGFEDKGAKLGRDSGALKWGWVLLLVSFWASQGPRLLVAFLTGPTFKSMPDEPSSANFLREFDFYTAHWQWEQTRFGYASSLIHACLGLATFFASTALFAVALRRGARPKWLVMLLGLVQLFLALDCIDAFGARVI